MRWCRLGRGWDLWRWKVLSDSPAGENGKVTQLYCTCTLHCSLYTTHCLLQICQCWKNIIKNIGRKKNIIPNIKKKYSAHCTLPTTHCILHTEHWTLHTAYFTLHTPHCTQNAEHCILCTAHYTMHTIQCTLHTAHSVTPGQRRLYIWGRWHQRKTLTNREGNCTLHCNKLLSVGFCKVAILHSVLHYTNLCIVLYCVNIVYCTTI